MWSISTSILCMLKKSSWFWSLAYRSILLLICLLSSCFMWAQDLLSSAPYECWHPRLWLGLVTAISFLCHSGSSFKMSYFKIVKQLILTKATGNLCLQLEENQYSKCLCVSIIHMLEEHISSDSQVPTYSSLITFLSPAGSYCPRLCTNASLICHIHIYMD